MSRRIDKKKNKKYNAATAVKPAEPTVPSVESVEPALVPTESEVLSTVPAESTALPVPFYIQYQNSEYLEQDIVAKVTDQCTANGVTSAELQNLTIYLKPEDKKAYFTYGENKNGFIEL